MKKIVAVAAAFALAPLAACADNAQEELAEQELESQEDVLEEQADLADEMGMEGQEEMLDDQADAMGEAADNVDIDAADDVVTDDTM